MIYDGMNIISPLAGLHVPKKWFFFLQTQAEKRAFSQLKAFISA